MGWISGKREWEAIRLHTEACLATLLHLGLVCHWSAPDKMAITIY